MSLTHSHYQTTEAYQTYTMDRKALLKSNIINQLLKLNKLTSLTEWSWTNTPESRGERVSNKKITKTKEKKSKGVKKQIEKKKANEEKNKKEGNKAEKTRQNKT